MSERGLAGAFNTNIVRAARKRAEELQAEGKTVLFYLVGKKGRAVIQRVFPKQIVHQVDLSHVKNLKFADRSEEHTSELQSLMRISYAVFCLKKKKYIIKNTV